MKNEDPLKRTQYIEHKARACTEEDFLDGVEDKQALKKNKEVWEQFKGDLLICPDPEDKEDLVLQNDFTFKERKFFQLVFSRCTNDKDWEELG